MKTALFAVAAIALGLAGCTGSTYNKDKSCTYDYLLHPSVSISKAIGGCSDASAKVTK